MVSLLKTDHRANGQSRAQSLLVFRSAGQARRIWVRDRQKAYFKPILRFQTETLMIRESSPISAKFPSLVFIQGQY